MTLTLTLAPLCCPLSRYLQFTCNSTPLRIRGGTNSTSEISKRSASFLFLLLLFFMPPPSPVFPSPFPAVHLGLMVGRCGSGYMQGMGRVNNAVCNLKRNQKKPQIRQNPIKYEGRFDYEHRKRGPGYGSERRPE